VALIRRALASRVTASDTASFNAKSSAQIMSDFSIFKKFKPAPFRGLFLGVPFRIVSQYCAILAHLLTLYESKDFSSNFLCNVTN